MDRDTWVIAAWTLGYVAVGLLCLWIEGKI